MEDFDRIIIKDVVIEIVNLTRATYKEALIFKDILNYDLSKNFKKIVIDIRQCEFIDSSFLGVIVYIKKNVIEMGGDVKIVKSYSSVRTILEKVGANRFFSIYDTIEAAVQSYGTKDRINNFQSLKQDSRKKINMKRLYLLK